MSESGFPCFISRTRNCNSTSSEGLVFIIGSGSSEFSKEIETIKEVLKGFGLEGYFALLSEKEKGLDAFCDKICSKILGSIFCVILLNNPIMPELRENRILRCPSPNVHYEYGIAVALRKNIIPIMKKGMTLPFNIQHIDVIFYEDLEGLKAQLIESVKATMCKERSDKMMCPKDLMDNLRADLERIKMLVIEAIKEPKKGIYLDRWNSAGSSGRLMLLSQEQLNRLESIYSSIKDFDQERKLIEEAERDYWDKKASSIGQEEKLRMRWSNNKITYQNNAYKLTKKIEELLEDKNFWYS